MFICWTMALGWTLPSADAYDGLSRDLQAFLGMDLVDVVHPGMSVFDIEDAPGERPCNYHIEASADGDAGTVLSVLHRIIAAFVVVRESSVAIVPFLEQFFAEITIHNLQGDFSSTKHSLSKGREPFIRHGCPAKSTTVKERVSTVVRVRHVQDQAPIHFRDDLEFWIDACSARTTPTYAGASAKKSLEIGEGG